MFVFCALSTALLGWGHARAQERLLCESAKARDCLAAQVLADAAQVSERAWHDQILRNLAESLTYDKRVDDATHLIGKISNPDTQAMTIRAIGMAAALYGKDDTQQLRRVFEKLTQASTNIAHDGARAIATTYIAMAQAFAGLDDDAIATAKAMTNDALRRKAYGESAEIQAERGDLAAATRSIKLIDTRSYRNKAYANVADIFIKAGNFDAALLCAQMISNPSRRAHSLLAIMKAQEERARAPRHTGTTERHAK